MFAISPTDNNWFNFLKDSGLNSYVNFWTPTPWNIQKLNVNDKWYFLLKSPIRLIGGFGEFVEYKNLTPENAWNEFGHRNGFDNKLDFIKTIQKYIDKNSKLEGGKHIDISSYEIGCIVLKNCEFWDEQKYISLDDYKIDFAKQIVTHKYFYEYDPFTNTNDSTERFDLIRESREEYKKNINSRKGQSEFKGKILKAYNNKCSISGETCPELLEAAHLQNYINTESNHVQNGLLLRVDLHRLLDNGLLCIDSDYVVHVSSILKGPIYQQYNGIKISLPNNPSNYPSKEALQLIEKNFRR